MRRAGAHPLWGAVAAGRFHCEAFAFVHCREQLVLHVARGGRRIRYLVRHSESPSGASPRLVQKESGKKRARFLFFGGGVRDAPRLGHPGGAGSEQPEREPCFSAE